MIRWLGWVNAYKNIKLSWNSSPVGFIVKMYQLTKEKMYFIVGNTIRKQVTF